MQTPVIASHVALLPAGNDGNFACWILFRARGTTHVGRKAFYTLTKCFRSLKPAVRQNHEKRKSMLAAEGVGWDSRLVLRILFKLWFWGSVIFWSLVGSFYAVMRYLANHAT